MTHLKETTRITIGNSSFPFRPLTIGQIEAIMPIVGRIEDARRDNVASAIIAMALDLIHVALVRLSPALTKEELREIEASPSDLMQAVTAILKESGLQAEAPGERKARARVST
jgi:hypothetical protein